MSETFVSENQRGEVRLTNFARQLTSGGGKPGQGYPAVLTSSTGAGPAKATAWPASGPVYPMNAAVYGLRSDGCCASCGHDGSSVKMFPDYLASVLALPASLRAGGPRNTSLSALEQEEQDLADALSAARGRGYAQLIRDVISGTYSLTWMTSGTVSRGELSMRAGSESPNVVVACSLSAVLETRPVPPRYWLSAKAAAGILRRAGLRGKDLPPQLRAALESLARSAPTTGTSKPSTRGRTSSSQPRP